MIWCKISTAQYGRRNPNCGLRDVFMLWMIIVLLVDTWPILKRFVVWVFFFSPKSSGWVLIFFPHASRWRMKRMNRMKMMYPGARRICAFEKSFIFTSFQFQLSLENEKRRADYQKSSCNSTLRNPDKEWIDVWPTSPISCCVFFVFLNGKKPVLSLGHKINRPIPEAGSALHGTTWALPCLGHGSRDWMDQTVNSSKSFLTCYEGAFFGQRFSWYGFHSTMKLKDVKSDSRNVYRCLVLRTPSGTWANETEPIGIFWDKACGINQRINLMVFCFQKCT